MLATRIELRSLRRRGAEEVGGSTHTESTLEAEMRYNDPSFHLASFFDTNERCRWTFYERATILLSSTLFLIPFDIL